MLVSFSVKNFALIEDIQVDFSQGLSVITGETGAGKSILLDALGLVLGNRAEMSSLRDPTKKCIIEVEFDVKSYSLASFFEKYDLDYDQKTFCRREILPSGKSRAFINDSPVTLESLKKLGVQLVDIHTQHQTAHLSDAQYHLSLVDAFAQNENLLKKYQQERTLFVKAKNQYVKSLSFQANETSNFEYNTFLLKELQEVNLTPSLQEELEKERLVLQHAQDIKESISQILTLARQEDTGFLDQLNSIKSAFMRIASYGAQFISLHDRIESTRIELEDVFTEIYDYADEISEDPGRLEWVENTLSTLFALQQKHHVNTTEQLLEIQESLVKKVSQVQNIEIELLELKNEMIRIEKNLSALTQKLSKSRKECVVKLKSELELMLQSLGMENASFLFEFETSSDFGLLGKDQLNLMFSANKGASHGLLTKIASGGELSRIMLVIKSILSTTKHLPTLILDEIDTGVSGQMAHAMAQQMQSMSNNMQVISITHLPQIAAKGDTHFKVYKLTDQHSTKTYLKKLNKEERILEIAEMLDGKQLTDSARFHASQLLN